MNKIIAALSVTILLLTNSAFAANKTFIREYTYMASDLDSKVSSRAIALEQVKRALLEELGTYLISDTEVKNFQLTKDQVTTLTAGIVSAQVVEEKWDGRSYYLKARISADPDQVAKSLDTLRNDVQKTRELEDSRKKADDAMREVEQLKKELALARADTSKQGEYNHAINKLSAFDWLNKANKFFDANDFHAAIDAFNKVIELDPKNVYAYSERGSAYDILGNHQQAIIDYTKAIELEPKNAEGYTVRGDAYQALGKYKQVVADYTKAIELTPKNPTLYSERALAYEYLDKHQQAIADYTKMIELNPKDWSAYNYRGDAFKGLGKYQQAIADYTKVIELHPEDKYTYLKRGNTYRDFRKYQQAIANYTKVIEMHPKDKLTYLGAYGDRGNTYTMLGDYQRAIADFTRIIELHPKDRYTYASAYADRGNAYNMLDDYQHAIADFTKEIELYPKNADGYKNRGIVYEKWRKQQRANADYKMAARLGDTMTRTILKARGITW
jgi:tetratricopeptide (TPR) repeat protein